MSLTAPPAQPHWQGPMSSRGKSAPACSCMPPVPPPPRLCIGSTGWHMQMPAVHVRLDTWCTAQSPPAHTSRHCRTSATTEAVRERSQHRTLVFWGASTGLLWALAAHWESPDLTKGLTMPLVRLSVPHIHPNAAQATLQAPWTCRHPACGHHAGTCREKPQPLQLSSSCLIWDVDEGCHQIPGISQGGRAEAEPGGCEPMGSLQ